MGWPKLEDVAEGPGVSGDSVTEADAGDCEDSEDCEALVGLRVLRAGRGGGVEDEDVEDDNDNETAEVVGMVEEGRPKSDCGMGGCMRRPSRPLADSSCEPLERLFDRRGANVFTASETENRPISGEP